MPKPLPATYPAQFDSYIKEVPDDKVLDAIRNQQPVIDDFLSTITEEQSMFSYAPGKWTLKEMLQHIIDAERIFAYRALCFARREQQGLPAFEEDDYAANSNANARSWSALLEEMKIVRKSTLLLYESFTDEMLESPGIASDKPATPNVIGFVLVGHLYHHKNVIEERYRLR